MAYPGWEAFGQHFDLPLAQFIRIYQPAFFQRIGLRYVNIFSRRALERAMEPFYREVSGGRMGMGLHICKLLCERHGGDLSICNNAKGGGLVCASFAFQGPLLKK